MTRICWCCESINGRPTTPARYIWHMPSGNSIPLCVSCCAGWRENAANDPELQAELIESIHDTPTSAVAC